MMRSLLFRISVGLVLALAGLVAARAASLAPSVIRRVEAATFEVVQAKPTQDPLTYAKPLPLQLLPYQERTDKYNSIGTAFALGHGRYVTSAHVLMSGMDSLWGPPELRDSKGNVYPIDQVEKFGLRRDFVVFTVTGHPGDTALTVDTQPALNQPVYAIGNALGTGVVSRSGLYTSATPEALAGAWKWLRFSAAASPGNGGGPLLDQAGNVIGLVVAKSPGENLNYALPIAEVLAAPTNRALMHVQSVAHLLMTGSQEQGVFKAGFALPLPLAGFYREFGQAWNRYDDRQQAHLLTRESADLFPNGEGARHLLYLSVYPDAFPELILRQDDGVWTRFQNDTKRLELGHNGYLSVNGIDHIGLVHMRRPDNIPAAVFYNDAKVRMDLLASAGVFKRRVGTEPIKVTSLGTPSNQSEHTDRWQRPWHVAVWPLPFANMVTVVYELPVPDGCVQLMHEVSPADTHAAVRDLAELTNFVYVSYDGRLAQWKQFLQQRSLLPAAFKDIHIDFQYGHEFSYASPHLRFSYTPEVQPIRPDSQLWLGFRFFIDQGKPVWSAADVMVWKDSGSSDSDHITIQRFVKPPAGVSDYLTGMWQQVSGRQHPYDGVPRAEGDMLKVDTVAAPPGRDASMFLYSVFIGTDGDHPVSFVQQKLDALMGTVSVAAR